MSVRSLLIVITLIQILVSCDPGKEIDLPANTWVLVEHNEQGARRVSSFRYVDEGRFFLLWGFLGQVTEFYGNPEEPLENPPEYDLVGFDPAVARWQNHLPLDKQEEWSRKLPPLHMVSSYQGITTGSRRPELKMREGVLRPDLNMVFDQVAYDSARHRMVYFTGGRTFAYDVVGRTWSDIAPGEVPPPVQGGSLAYDPVLDKILLFGGGHVAEMNDRGELAGFTGTWSFDAPTGEWKQLSPGLEPPPRMSTRMVYDRKNQQMVLFGGDAQTRYLCDTWLFDTRTGTWRETRSRTSPPARAGHFMVYDEPSGWVIAGGGYNRENLDDLWAYDGSKDTWFPLKGKVPIGWYVTADLDPSRRLILLTTSTKPEGDTMGCNEIYSVRSSFLFRIDSSTLVDSTATALPQAPVQKRTNEEATAGTAADPLRRQKQKQRIDEIPPNRWILLSDPGRTAPVRTWGSCSFDTRRGQLIYWGGGHCGYGGNDYDLYDVEENTWISRPVEAEYPERAWNKGIDPAGVTFGGAPWIRHGRKLYAYDPLGDRIINLKNINLTGGYDPPALREYEPKVPPAGTGENSTPSGYQKLVTWSFDPDAAKWEIACSALPGLELTVTTPKGVMAIDTNWRGLDTGNLGVDTPFEKLPIKENAVFLLDLGTRQWNKLSGSGPWPQNLYEMPALVWDSRRGRLILHGGGAVRDELWAFDPATGKWTKLRPQPGTTPPESGREAVYLERDDVFLTTGAPRDSRENGAVYAYRVGENAWHRLDIAPPEGMSAGAYLQQNRAMTYDPKHGLVLMVLGKGDADGAAVYALRYDHSRAVR